MNKMTSPVVAALVLLALAGCSAPESREATPVESTEVATLAPSTAVTPSAMPTPEAPAEPVPAPIVMAPEAPDERTAAQKAGFADDNAWYLASLKSSWTGELPTDEQLFGAAALVCEAFAGGSLPEDIVVVQGEGDAAFYNNQNTVGYALPMICGV